MRLLFFIAFISTFQLFGQEVERCATKIAPLSDQQENELVSFRNRMAFMSSEKREEQVIYNIPVVVHVVYNQPNEYFTYDQVAKQIEVLTNDFRRLNSDTILTPGPFKPLGGDVGIEFELAIQDPQGNPTNGITYTATNVTSFTFDNTVKFSSNGGSDAWDTRYYLNIWVCNMTGALGVTQPVSPGSNVDGVIVTTKAFSTYGSMLSPNFNLGRTVTHEVGHWLGMIHIWGDAVCGDDKIADTPPQATSTSDVLNCPPFPYKPSVDATCNTTNTGRMFPNYMDYTRDACMNIFTIDQAQKMRDVLLMYRSMILSSKGLDSPYKYDLSLFDLSIDTSAICNNSLNEFKLRVRNQGTDTITSYNLVVDINGVSNTFSWTGVMVPGMDTVWTVPIQNADVYNYKITSSVELLSPSTDEFLNNDTLDFSFQCNKTLSVYPNPVLDVLKIRGNNPQVVSATIYNLAGKEMLNVNAPFDIDITGLLPGCYLIVFQTKSNTIHQQLIVIH